MWRPRTCASQVSCSGSRADLQPQSDFKLRTRQAPQFQFSESEHRGMGGWGVGPGEAMPDICPLVTTMHALHTPWAVSAAPSLVTLPQSIFWTFSIVPSWSCNFLQPQSCHLGASLSHSTPPPGLCNFLFLSFLLSDSFAHSLCLSQERENQKHPSTRF